MEDNIWGIELHWLNDYEKISIKNLKKNGGTLGLTFYEMLGICSKHDRKTRLASIFDDEKVVGYILYYFYDNGNEEIYMSSADWMSRNLDRRVEILFPVEAPTLRDKCKKILEKQLKDTRKAHVLGADGNYKKVDKRGKEFFDSQQYFCDEAVEMTKEKEDVQNTRLFIPETHHE